MIERAPELIGGAAETCFVQKRKCRLDRLGGSTVDVVSFDGATDAMTAVRNGQVDATLQDLPAALFYRDRFPTLELAGPPVGGATT